MFILTVKELFSSIKINLESSFPFVMVKGTVINFSYDSRDNLYFSLKDEDTSINCVCWSSKFSKLTINPKEHNLKDKEIVIKGQLNVYKGGTRVSISVIDITIKQDAAFHLLLEEKEKELREAGYFNEEHKKALSLWPDKIGLITSKEGDAIVDILQAIEKRFPAKILIYNVSVQGKNAKSDIIEAINYFNSLPFNQKPKAIIIARGGGSFEDLLPFNEEDLVKAIFKSELPVVTAIGHSKNISLADYTADKYAITPTAVAELVASVSLLEYKKHLLTVTNLLIQALNTKINTYYNQQLLLEAKILDPTWYLTLKFNNLKENQSIRELLLKQIYHKHVSFLEEYKQKLPQVALNFIKSQANNLPQVTLQSVTIKTLAESYSDKLLKLKQELTQKIKFALTRNKEQLTTLFCNFFKKSSAINYKLEQFRFINASFYKEARTNIKQKLSEYQHTDNLLQSLSYKNTLKRGFALIKEENKDSLIKSSEDLKNKTNFDIIFYDKSVKITKK